MTDPRPYSKKELKQLFTNLHRKGITDDMIERLIETLWRNKYTMRTSGFANAGGPDAVISFSNATRTFTITPLDPEVETYVPRFSFYVWAYAAEYIQRFSAEEIQIPDEEGLYCIYYDTDDVSRVHRLFYSKNPGSLQLKNLYFTKVIVAFVYWDATASEALYFGDDRHGSEWNPQIHYTWHNAFHSRRKSGLQLQDLVINGDGSADAHAQFSVSAGEMFHDDFELTIPAGGNTLPVLYKFGSYPRFHQTAGYGIYKGASRICYNNGISVVEATESYHVLYHIFATNEILTEERKTISVMGMAEYEFLAGAYQGVDAELDEISAYMPHQGRCYLGSVIVQTSDTFTNAMAARIVGVIGDGIKFHPPVTIAPGSEDWLQIDEAQELAFSIFAEMSIQGDGSALFPFSLDNDESDPGPWRYYGTDENGDKQWIRIGGTGGSGSASGSGGSGSGSGGETLFPDRYGSDMLFNEVTRELTLKRTQGLPDLTVTIPGGEGASAYVYIAYASDASGTDFTNTFDADLDYIAILATDTEIVTPVVGDFAGLWKNYKGAAGEDGADASTADWIEFEFRDIEAGTAADYVLDLKALVDYTIDSAVLQVDAGTLTVAVKIGTTAVTGLSAVAVDTDIDETAATAANTVTAGDKVILAVSATYTGAPTLIRGKLNLTRT